MQSDYKKQLKVKSGIVKRITREFESYEKEVAKDKDRISKLRESGSDEHTIKKQEDVLQETLSMLPNTRKRLQDAVEDLQNLMREHENDEGFKESTEWAEANLNLESAHTKVLGESIV